MPDFLFGFASGLAVGLAVMSVLMLRAFQADYMEALYKETYEKKPRQSKQRRS